VSEGGFNGFLKLSHVGVCKFFSEPVVFFSCSGGDSHPGTIAQRAGYVYYLPHVVKRSAKAWGFFRLLWLHENSFT
jgi:hypothetical protein